MLLRQACSTDYKTDPETLLEGQVLSYDDAYTDSRLFAVQGIKKRIA